jgi:hypothetical protein
MSLIELLEYVQQQLRLGKLKHKDIVYHLDKNLGVTVTVAMEIQRSVHPDGEYRRFN